MWALSKYKFFGVFLGLFLCACQPNTKQNSLAGGALGTSYHIKYFGNGKSINRKIDSVFAAVNQSLSTYQSDSDISKINRGDSLLVTDMMFREVFELSKVVHLQSKGAFDPTVGVLVNAWGFGPYMGSNKTHKIKDSLLLLVGFDKVRLTNDFRVVKQHPDIFLDFNAIAKGYAVDRLAEMLQNEGLTDFLVEVGGEVTAKGKNLKNNRSWQLAIENPENPGSGGYVAVVALNNQALASSGNYRKYKIDSLSGEQMVHTVNPKTGEARKTKILGTSVIAQSCALADAWATALMVMPVKTAIETLKKRDELDGLLIYTDSIGETKQYSTKDFIIKAN